MKVILDRQPVSFDGPIPGSIEEIFSFLSQYLEQKDRVIREFYVDGIEILSAEHEVEIALEPKKLEAVSIAIVDFFDLEIKRQLSEIDKCRSQGKEASERFLFKEWIVALDGSQHLMQKWVAWVRLIEEMMNYAKIKGISGMEPLSEELKETEQFFAQYDKQVQQMDPAAMSDFFDYDFPQVLGHLEAVLTKVLKEGLLKKKADHEITQ